MAFGALGAASCILAFVLVLAGQRAVAQTTSKRQVYVSVTDPAGRIVTGLDRTNFVVVEDGVRRAITEFSDGSAPIALAVLTDQSEPDVANRGIADELIQTSSLPDALR